MQGIGIGVSDFKILRVKDNYFIDKSLFIKHVLDNQSAIALITRPRSHLCSTHQASLSSHGTQASALAISATAAASIAATMCACARLSNFARN